MSDSKSVARVKESDTHRVFFVRCIGRDSEDNYFEALDKLYPLLTAEEWNEVVTGFYINCRDREKPGCGSPICVRLTCFFECETNVEAQLGSYCASHALDLFDSEPSSSGRISDHYGGDELRFRTFLCTYSSILLDTLKNARSATRSLVVDFASAVFAHGPSRESYRNHFEIHFRKFSPFFVELMPTRQDTFWDDLVYWPNPPQYDWAHFLINMGLSHEPRDWATIVTRLRS